ncbi:flagellar hook-associated protein FlgL [Ramlibacter sp.]|uniref:flagellar hook-associated protein FlgL n=1 Tax=Ramlibacter sp. TaxID=1917967 RepID=UPI003D14E24D
MRIATSHTARQAFEAIGRRQEEQARLQDQISSGLRVRSPGDDPVAAAQAERARSRLAQIGQERRATDLAASILATADGALAQGVSILQDARAWLVAAGNGAYSAADRGSLAQQLAAAREQLLQVANADDGAGGYIFAGQGSTDAPFTSGGMPTYAATAGEQRVGTGRHATTLDGRATFMAIAQGNGVFVTASAAANTGAGWIDAGAVSDATALTGHSYRVTIAGTAAAPLYTVDDLTAGTTVAANLPFAAGSALEFGGQRIVISGAPAVGDSFDVAPAGRQSVFATLDDAIALLDDPGATNAQYAERLARVQAGLDRSLDAMVFSRTRAGEGLRQVDIAAARGEEAALSTESRRSDLQDMDIARGVSALQSSQTTLEAALRSYAGRSRASLFDFIGS